MFRVRVWLGYVRVGLGSGLFSHLVPDEDVPAVGAARDELASRAVKRHLRESKRDTRRRKAQD